MSALKAYKGIEDITGKHHTHLTVNHSREFINPATGAHTIAVSRVHVEPSQCKRMMQKEQTTHSKLFNTYLPEFMWWMEFDGIHQNAFNNILNCSSIIIAL